MQHHDILKRLRSTLLSLTVAEQRVANFCLKDPRSFAKLPVGEIADLTNVSKPTVVRFCRSAGFDGLSDFRRQLTLSVEDCVPFVHQSISKSDRPINVAYKLIDNVVSTMLSCRETIRPDLFELVVARILETHRNNGRVILIGIGSSGIAAKDAMWKLYRLGVNAQCFTTSHDQLLAASLVSSKDTLIAFSNSGRTREIIEACEVANKRTAATVVITATNTPLSFVGRYRLASDNAEAYENYSPMLSRIQQLVLVDILVTCFALAKGIRDVESALQEYSRNIDMHRYGNVNAF